MLTVVILFRFAATWVDIRGHLPSDIRCRHTNRFGPVTPSSEWPIKHGGRIARGVAYARANRLGPETRLWCFDLMLQRIFVLDIVNPKPLFRLFTFGQSVDEFRDPLCEVVRAGLVWDNVGVRANVIVVRRLRPYGSLTQTQVSDVFAQGKNWLCREPR